MRSRSTTPTRCAPFRDRFVIDDELVYLDGNSLGRLPRATVERLRDVVAEQWGERLIRAWDEGWMELPVELGDRLGAAALGAAPGQVVVADSTTVCFYKLASAALDARPGRDEIVTDRDNFPTDRYVLEGLAARARPAIRWLEPRPGRRADARRRRRARRRPTALVTFSHVDYRSAAIADMAAITTLAHDAGALMLWDLCHSAGVGPRRARRATAPTSPSAAPTST